jgi:hypothetical protein
MTVCQLYTDFLGRENTSQGGHARPKNFISWLHEVQIEMQNELIKALGNNQTVSDNLRFFTKSVQIPISQFKTGDIIPYPKDYRRFSSLRFFSKKENGTGCLCGDMPVMDDEGSCAEFTEEQKAEMLNSEQLCENEIEMVPNQNWGSVCKHELIGPSMELPYATQYDKGFKVLPKGIGIVVLDYIAIPERPKMFFSEDGRHNITCLPTSSTLLWGDEMIPELLARLKKRYSAFTRNSEGYKEGEQERQITTS